MLSITFCQTVSVILCLQTLILAKGNKLSEDGITVTNNGEVRALAGSWRVWVTIQVPWTPDSFKHELNRLAYFVNHSPFIPQEDSARPSDITNKTITVSQMVKESWLGRLQRIQQNLPRTKPVGAESKRHRRGLFDPMGEFVHELFGVATDAEVQEIRQVVGNINEDQAAVVHNMEILTSIVNRSRIYMAENRERLNEFTERFRRTELYLPKLTSEVNKLALQVEIERIIEDMEVKWDTLRNLQELYLHQRHDLQAGKLTEQLLPVSALTNILIKSQTQLRNPLDLNWYYMHNEVRPMWANPDYLVFEVMLRFVRPTKFLLYTISTWPVPVSETSSARMVERGQYGYNTHNGELFSVKECHGTQPKVCHADPVWGVEAKPCIRGILTNNPSLMDDCTLELRTGNVSIINHVSGNEYILSTWGETAIQRCEGKHPKSIRYSRGVYKVLVKPGCNLYGALWNLQAIDLFNNSVTIDSQIFLRSNPLNLSGIMHATMKQYDNPIKFSKLDPVAMVPVALLKNPSIQPIRWSQHGGWLAWVLAGIGLCAAIVIGGYCMYKQCQERFQKGCRNGDYSLPQRKPSVELQETALNEPDSTAVFLSSLEKCRSSSVIP